MLIKKCVMILAAVMLLASGASADPLTVSCADEDAVHAGWDSPLSVSYAGGPYGDIKLKSEHIDLILPASLSERSAEMNGADARITDISGFAEIDAVMPDVTELLACTAKNVQPEFKDDADVQALAFMSCAPQTRGGSAKISATVRIGLLPAEGGIGTDVIVEVKRRYLDVKTPIGQDIAIETFPKDCKITTQ